MQPSPPEKSGCGRLRYSEPKSATQLCDKASRQSMQRLENQFFQSARSITPPPATLNWVPQNRLLVTIDGTNDNQRFARPKKSSNTMDPANANNIPVTMNLYTAHGGDVDMRRIVNSMIRSGHFDEEVLNYANELEGEDSGIAANNRFTTSFTNNMVKV